MSGFDDILALGGMQKMPDGSVKRGPKYPDIKVKLVGKDGNAFAILGRVDRALSLAGVEKAERDAFHKEATSGNYDHLLQTCMKWVKVK